jgi:hypothetical protein
MSTRPSRATVASKNYEHVDDNDNDDDNVVATKKKKSKPTTASLKKRKKGDDVNNSNSDTDNVSGEDKPPKTTTNYFANVLEEAENANTRQTYKPKNKWAVQDEISQRMKVSEWLDKTVEFPDDTSKMNDDDYIRLIEMMDALDTNPVETVTTPINVEGLMTLKELKPYRDGDTSNKAFREKQAKKLVDENKMTPEMGRRFGLLNVKKKTSVKGGSFDEEMEKEHDGAEEEEFDNNDDDGAEEEEFDNNDDDALIGERTSRRAAKKKVTYFTKSDSEMDLDEEDSNDDEGIQPKKRVKVPAVKSNKSGGKGNKGKNKIAIDSDSDEFELFDSNDDADESITADSEEDNDSGKEELRNKGVLDCRLCRFEDCRKYHATGKDGYCGMHFSNKNFPILNSKYKFINKIRRVLDDEAFMDIISWSDDGKYFQIHDIGRFTTEILSDPFFGSVNEYQKFQQKLNTWGFKLTKQCKSEVTRLRFTGGVVTRSIYHTSFVKGRPELFNNVACIY